MIMVHAVHGTWASLSSGMSQAHADVNITGTSVVLIRSSVLVISVNNLEQQHSLGMCAQVGIVFLDWNSIIFLIVTVAPAAHTSKLGKC